MKYCVCCGKEFDDSYNKCAYCDNDLIKISNVKFDSYICTDCSEKLNCEAPLWDAVSYPKLYHYFSIPEEEAKNQIEDIKFCENCGRLFSISKKREIESKYHRINETINYNNFDDVPTEENLDARVKEVYYLGVKSKEQSDKEEMMGFLGFIVFIFLIYLFYSFTGKI